MGYTDNIKKLAKELEIKKGDILITGATGLIGSCLIDVLLAANKYCLSEFVVYAMSRSFQKLKTRFEDKIIPIVQDVCMPLETSINFDYIIHAASNADPRKYATEPVETVLTNVVGMKNILDYCKNHKNTRVLMVSSFEVYGMIDGTDTYSEDMSGNVDFQYLRNGYTESKRCAEILLRSYVDEYGVNGVIARLASIYGPTMAESDSKAHAQFINKAVQGQNVILKSKGTQKRTYCYVIDAVSGIMTILIKGKKGEAYNVANEGSTATIAEVAEACAKLSGTKVVYDLPDKIEQKGFSKPQNCILNCSKLRTLGWNGKFSLIDGLQETILTLTLNSESSDGFYEQVDEIN